MSERLKGHLAMLAFSALIAGSFALGSMAAPHIAPTALNAVRFVAASAILGSVALAVTGLPREAFRAPWRYLLLGGAMGIYFVLMFEGLKTAPPVSAAAVFTLTPILAGGFGFLLLRQAMTARMAFALSVGGIGALWVIFRGDVGAMLGFRMGPGERLFLIGVIAHAFYTPLVRVLNRGEPVIVFAFGTILGALVMVALWAGRSLFTVDWPALPAIVWVAVGYTAICATAGSFMLLQFAALRLPAGKVMAYTYLTPAFVILWEGALGRGWPSPPVWIGAAVSALALALLAWR